MENIQKPKVGASIKTMSIIQLVVSGFGIIGFIISIFTKDKTNALLKGSGVPEITTSVLIIGLVFSIILGISVILILMKKELGIYIYFIAVVAQIVYGIVSTGFKPLSLVGLVMPVLMGIFIWKKKEIYSVKVEA
jgi:hypothetical protein